MPKQMVQFHFSEITMLNESISAYKKFFEKKGNLYCNDYDSSRRISQYHHSQYVRTCVRNLVLYVYGILLRSCSNLNDSYVGCRIFEESIFLFLHFKIITIVVLNIITIQLHVHSCVRTCICA